MLLIHLVVKSFLAALRVSRLPSIGAALTPAGRCAGNRASTPEPRPSMGTSKSGLRAWHWRGGCELKARYPPRAVLSRGSGRTVQSEDRLVNVSLCQYVQSEPKISL